MCKTWILKIATIGFDVRHLTIFQTENETKTLVFYKDVPWATEYGNISFHAAR